MSQFWVLKIKTFKLYSKFVHKIFLKLRLIRGTKKIGFFKENLYIAKWAILGPFLDSKSTLLKFPLNLLVGHPQYPMN